MLFLWVKDLLKSLSYFTGWIAFQNDALTYLAALRRSHKFDLGVISITSTKYHTLRHDVSEFSRL